MHQGNAPRLTIPYILMTCLFHSLLILQGEIKYKSLSINGFLKPVETIPSLYLTLLLLGKIYVCIIYINEKTALETECDNWSLCGCNVCLVNCKTFQIYMIFNNIAIYIFTYF